MFPQPQEPTRRFYAHSLPGRPVEEWEFLEDHLRDVAELAQDFASAWNAGDWGYVAGLWHDLGKYSNEFQAYLRAENGFEAHIEAASRVDHSTAGAQHAARTLSDAGRLIAYCIAGHHAGLADHTSETGHASLNARLRRTVPLIPDAPSELLKPPTIKAPQLDFSHGQANRAAFQLSLFCKMLFSCLVDADFLSTEEFMRPEQSRLRFQNSRPLEVLLDRLRSHVEDLQANAGQSRNDVFKCRREVFDACRDAASSEPGLFSLTVPTGGGKTLSSLAFALQHALQHNFKRVIYAIPFTSIIEQTADTFRRVFAGLDAVLEHYSNFDPRRETPGSRLASENWDAPLVVTTNVQLFESLFARRTSHVRKLHRLARSVVILDEVQTLPVDLLTPCLAMLRELAGDYSCTIVLCTATQPAILQQPIFPIGLENVREIVPEPAALYRRMKRVQVHFVGRLGDEELLERLIKHDQFLCIVNTRSHAARLFDALRNARPGADQAGLFHLSTWMCGVHRARVLAKIRERLTAGLTCQVVSTQLVEAGVDIDFPAVYRALAGVDSIAQAAGRCNREGTRASATVYVFDPADVHLRGFLASTAASAKESLPDANDLLDPEIVKRYFELHYWKHSDRWDQNGIMDLFRSPREQVFQFREASKRFRMIEETGQPTIIPWESKGRRLVERLRREEPKRHLRRQLQRYTVNVYDNVYRQMLGKDLEEVRDGFTVLLNMDCYDNATGLRIDLAGFHEPHALIV